MQDQFFEWDDLKATRNWLDHAVTFETAKFAFEDAFGIERADLREDYGEDRTDPVDPENAEHHRSDSQTIGCRTLGRWRSVIWRRRRGLGGSSGNRWG